MNKTAISIQDRLYHYARLLRLHRPIGILLLLWPTLWALWIASSGKPNLTLLLIFIAGVVIMRSAGCVINDIADRNFDRHVARTKDRPLANKTVSLHEALIIFFMLVLCAFILVLFLNVFAIKLAFVAIALAIIYPFTKRITHLPQVVLGMAYHCSILMAFAATTNSLPPIAWLLFIIGVLWSVIYDTMYALVDKPDDLRIGIKSTAILFANSANLILGILQIIVLSLFVLLGVILNLNAGFYLAVTVAAGMSAYQQYLIRGHSAAGCFKAFLNNNWLGFIIFIGLLVALRH